MTIAVASGKGGTGKTSVAVGLAWILAESGVRTTYIDCDVEEPNGHIFLDPAIDSMEDVAVPVPVVDAERCDLCGRCAEFCAYNALACLKDRVLVFPDICHGCGGCAIVCPRDAIGESPQPVGVVERGRSGAVGFLQGRLLVGAALAVPIIRRLKHLVPDDGVTILDAPPGTSCPVIETLRGVDRVLLVAEPTPFGMSDLTLAVGGVREMKLPLDVVINKSGLGDGRVRDYCRDEGIEVLAEIPNDRAIAEAYARGAIPAAEIPDVSAIMESLAAKLVPEEARR